MSLKENHMTNGVEALIVNVLSKVPVLSGYCRTRGPHYVIAWCHRLSGIGMVLYLFLHIYTLNLLGNPSAYDAQMAFFSSPAFAFLEWALSIPVIFHALNGGRLILYENFGVRNDDAMLRYTIVLSLIYVIVLGMLMGMGNQNVSAIFFWMTMLVASCVLVYIFVSQRWGMQHTILWKLHRVTAIFLLVMVPAHFIFAHLNLAAAHDAETVALRMQHWFIKMIDLLLLLSILYHAGYGTISILTDYLGLKRLRFFCAGIVVLLLCLAAIVCINLTIFI